MPPNDHTGLDPEGRVPRRWTPDSWKLGVGLALIAAALAAAAWNRFQWCALTGSCRSIEALNITKVSETMIHGGVRLIASNGIATDGWGGACVIFENPAATCQAGSQCAVPGFVPDTGIEQPHGYCADSKCWIKVNEAHCWKSRSPSKPDPVPLTIGTDQPTPNVETLSLPIQFRQGSANKEIKARVVACLNGKFTPAPGRKPPCAGGAGDHIEKFGNVATVRL